MIALLQYGQFTAMIQLPGTDPQYTVAVMKPMEELSLLPLDDKEFGKTDLDKTTRLEFRLKDRLRDDIWLYEFIGEA